MPSVFSSIINGDLPGTFVWRDPQVVAFLSIAPLTPGHTLVVPRAEVDHWTDLAPAVWAHAGEVARVIGAVQREVFDAPRAGLIVAGFEVPHTHLHVFPAWTMGEFDFRAATPADPADLAAPARMIRERLTALGHAEAQA
ncbi:HIT family protein [Nakamurella leprariae]|uniref:HIT family protein n=1 Tax=Nakamurella leprariae TaxID=2803911 RepID=A0A939BZJ0_9ACTN|nr:HIT family protein [Nakamurella leprariae]MBM9467756.1 HIT family protein [Nakamurella leprariae]